jgi:hypothetical protein
LAPTLSLPATEAIIQFNSIQFQPGLSMFAFIERYDTEEKCEAAIAAARWRLRPKWVGSGSSRPVTAVVRPRQKPLRRAVIGETEPRKTASG